MRCELVFRTRSAIVHCSILTECWEIVFRCRDREHVERSVEPVRTVSVTCWFLRRGVFLQVAGPA